MKFESILVGASMLCVVPLLSCTNESKDIQSSLDADRDGKVSMEEAKGMSELSNQFKALDADLDGNLDQAELSKFEAAEEGEAMETKSMDAPGSDTEGTVMPGGHDSGGDAEVPANPAGQSQ